ncbi:TIGR02556 family CRISPR-associated protein [Thermoanaerobacterium sp. RBIITD]|uniref:TIGR02556 family CRISPR-associated protein n=1 Tax=Thermoanaerobacterium sp. RBIITD TaxID=1550240 RepID=UPI000BB87753|nr:TIGR02556 family CRISPR-associated protein [Thermoanaerobacterium sp. RBIITD]SNX53630.1 CRISPR-associated protein, Csh1 family [Thermoanaerobacterium sp. RBIITD]
MINAVKELGEMIIKAENKSLLDVLIEDPNSNGTYNNIVTINFIVDNGDIQFDGVKVEQYERSKLSKYLYTSAGGNGPGYMPIAKITEPKKTFNTKIESWFNILNDKNAKLSNDDRVFLEKVQKNLEDNSNKIIEEIEKFRKEYPKKEGLVLMLKFKDSGEYKYIGDYKLFRDLLLLIDSEKYRKLYAEDKVCSICGEKRDLVFGKIDTYKFYTIDKKGYITGGFNEKESWKNYPVCPECRLALEEGKKYAETNLSFKFYGLKYQLIPRFIVGEEYVKDNVLDVFINSNKLVTLKNSIKKRVIADEDEILDYLKDADDTLTLNFLFIQKSNSAERILLLIEDVFPSHLREIFVAKEAVDKIFGEGFTFRNIRNFLSKSDSNKRNSDLDGYFLDITDRVFRGKAIDFSFLLRFIMKRVREEFANDRYYKNAIKDGMMAVTFLEKLELIEMEVSEMEERVFDGIFEKYGEDFKTPLKRGLILLGALTELLLRKQYKDREAKPFMKNLKGLKMTEKDIKGLLPKVQNKLEEYDSFDKGKRLLAKEASNYLLLAGDDWHMPVDEINFYFACGINLTDDFVNIIYKKEEEK